MSHHRLYLPVGPPGCGKSTLVEWATEAGVIEPDAVVSPDYFRRVMTGNKLNQSHNANVFKVVESIAFTRLNYGRDVWMDGTNMYARVRDEYIRQARYWNAGVTVILFYVEPDVLRYRNKKRPSSDQLPVDVMDRYIDQYVKLMEHDSTGFDADVIVSDETFRKIAQPKEK